jgi:hypothetical protein
MEKLKQQQHWTSNTVGDFVFQIASDFTLQLEKRLEDGPITNRELAKRLKITAGRVSQVLNTPGNFKLRSMTEYARALGLKLAIVAYDDGDPENKKGPINSGVFYECWKRQGRPQDFYDLSTPLVIQPIRYSHDEQVSVATDSDRQSERRFIYPSQSMGTRGFVTVQ